ncbi:MAG: hypothetical protein ACYC61_25675 [Isosphaeraceae bacterium]
MAQMAADEFGCPQMTQMAADEFGCPQMTQMNDRDNKRLSESRHRESPGHEATP